MHSPIIHFQGAFIIHSIEKEINYGGRNNFFFETELVGKR